MLLNDIKTPFARRTDWTEDKFMAAKSSKGWYLVLNGFIKDIELNSLVLTCKEWEPCDVNGDYLES